MTGKIEFLRDLEIAMSRQETAESTCLFQLFQLVFHASWDDKYFFRLCTEINRSNFGAMTMAWLKFSPLDNSGILNPTLREALREVKDAVNDGTRVNSISDTEGHSYSGISEKVQRQKIIDALKKVRVKTAKTLAQEAINAFEKAVKKAESPKGNTV